MSRMTALDHVRFIRKGAGSPSTVEWTDLDLLRILNVVSEEISATHDIAEYDTYEDITTVSGTETYEFTASDISSLSDFARNTTETQLIKRSARRENTKKRSNIDSDDGSPRRFLETEAGTNDRKQISYDPIPDDAYVIRQPYQKFETLVLSPTPTSFTWPQAFDMMAAEAAVERVLALDGQRSDAAAQVQLTDRADKKASKTAGKASKTIFRPNSRMGRL